MTIEHVAIWTNNLEALKEFYVSFFGAKEGPKYHNPKRNFESYFLTFDGGCRLELMSIPELGERASRQICGIAHIAFSTGSKEAVDALTEELLTKGVKVVSGPRTTGDGYYESVVLDPDGNVIEITI